MDKVSKLQKQLDELVELKDEYEDLVMLAEQNIFKTEMEIAQSYQDFFTNKRNTEFVLYDKFPGLEALKLYISKISTEFPLYEVGSLNAKELAELIKHFYQFKRGAEYDILTIGATELYEEPIYVCGRKSLLVEPHMCFIIGNDKTLAPFREYDGQFFNEHKVYNSIFLNARKKDLISIELDMGWNLPKIDIECLTGSYEDKSNQINFFDYEKNCYTSLEVDKFKDIYNFKLENVPYKKGCVGYQGIQDILDFNINILDSFIAKMLISITIYKQNNNIQELTSEDYNHIFDVLYGEKVDIIGQADKDIPKKLVYVPNEKHGK